MNLGREIDETGPTRSGSWSIAAVYMEQDTEPVGLGLTKPTVLEATNHCRSKEFTLMLDPSPYIYHPLDMVCLVFLRTITKCTAT